VFELFSHVLVLLLVEAGVVIGGVGLGTAEVGSAFGAVVAWAEHSSQYNSNEKYDQGRGEAILINPILPSGFS
jgi:hypothetical protein